VRAAIKVSQGNRSGGGGGGGILPRLLDPTGTTRRQVLDSWEELARDEGRGLHSSTFQLNLSHFWRKIHPRHSLIHPETH
jgi:hypothetical protein